MEVLLVSFFSMIIIFMTVVTLIKAYNIAINRKEISKKKYIVLIISSSVIGLLIAMALPFVFEKVFLFLG